MNEVNIDELKNLIKSSTSVLILENGEPSFVALGYDVYKSLVSQKNDSIENVKASHDKNGISPEKSIETKNRDRETEILERLNNEILALKNKIEAEERGLDNPTY